MLKTIMRRMFRCLVTAAVAAMATGETARGADPADIPERFAYTAPEFAPPHLRTRPRNSGDDETSRRMAEADRLAGERKWNEAAREVNALLEQYPDDADLLSRAGHYYMMMRAYAVSEGYWSRLAALRPDNAWSVACWGGILVRLGQLTEARAVLEKAHALNGREIVARYHLACLSLKDGDIDKARAVLGSMTLLEIGNCATWTRDDAQSLESLLGMDHLRQLCSLVLGGGEAATAGGVDVSGMDVAALQAMLNRAAQDLWTSYQAIQRKDWPSAETNLASAVEHGVHAPAATQGLAYCRVMMNDSPKALAMMRELAESYPDSAFVQLKYGLLCLDLEKYDDAATAFLHAHTISPDDNEIAVNLAGACVAAGRADDAWNVLEGIPAADRPGWAGWFNQPRPYARTLKQDARFPAWVTKLED